MFMDQIMGTPVLFVNRFSVIDTDNNVAMTIGQRLKQVRKERGLTQVELAARVGMKQSTLSDLELGKSAGTTNLAVVASVLGVNALWLETGRGPMTAEDVGKVLANKASGEGDALVRLLTVYHRADSHGKGAIDDVVDLVEARLAEIAGQHRQTG
jgi:transcriptional regulator with XRE-family HTH domain